MESKIVRLKNDIEFFYKQNKNTPRAALCMNFALNDYDSAPGVYALMARLLFQGTKTRSAEQIAEEFEITEPSTVIESKDEYGNRTFTTVPKRNYERRASCLYKRKE